MPVPLLSCWQLPMLRRRSCGDARRYQRYPSATWSCSDIAPRAKALQTRVRSIALIEHWTKKIWFHTRPCPLRGLPSFLDFKKPLKPRLVVVADHRQHCLPRKLCKGGLGQRGKGGWINVLFTRDREGLRYETMSRVLYRAADGSWRTAEPGAGVSAPEDWFTSKAATVASGANTNFEWAASTRA